MYLSCTYCVLTSIYHVCIYQLYIMFRSCTDHEQIMYLSCTYHVLELVMHFACICHAFVMQVSIYYYINMPESNDEPW